MLTIGRKLETVATCSQSRFGAMPESLVIKCLRSSSHVVSGCQKASPRARVNFSNLEPLPECSRLSRKASLSVKPMIDSNGRGVEIVESRMELFTVDADNHFRRGRAPGGSTREWSNRKQASERTSIVGWETRKELSSVEIKSKPNSVSSRREVQGGPDNRNDAGTAFVWGFQGSIY